MIKNKYLKFTVDILVYTVGCFIYSAAVTMFISANHISPGGITGISTLLNFLFKLPTGITLLVLNIPIIIAGFIKLGGIFIVKTSIATVLLSLTLEITDATLPAFEMDNILASLFGGIMMGAGLSLVMLRGATTGGVDIIAKLINRRYRHLTVGRLMLLMDGIVITLSAITYKNIESALYSVVALYASSKIMDTILYGADKGKIIYIVTKAPDDICNAVNKRLKRGITRLSAVGGYTGENHVMLMCTVRKHEVSSVYSIINEFDRKAFIVVSEAGEIIGEGFKEIE